MGDFRRDRRGRDRDFRPREFERSKPFDNPRRRDFDRRSSERFTVICDKCGEECEVPFKPTAGKPVYCDSCFRKKDGFEPRGQPRQQGSNPNELKEINRKLDKILEILDSLEIVEDKE
jgi:CxxC-x17-CxxC domain-containing protein